MKKKVKGEVTLEAAIVVPILILVVISLIYFALYVHDLLIIKSYAYTAGIENINSKLEEFDSGVKEKVSKAPVFVMSPIINCYENNSKYVIEINGINTSSLRFLNNIVEGETMKVELQQSIDRDNMYLIRSLIDIVE